MSSHALPLALTEMFRFENGQTARQFVELGLAFVLSSLIGLERERQQKSAGLRTHTLVGVGSALFMLVSEHGFYNVLDLDNISFDPSRVAAQVVSGIGFIGGGLIFVRRDAVRGLTTAATVWLTCGVGMACGGGLPLIALAATLVHFLAVQGYPWLSKRAGQSDGMDRTIEVRVRYRQVGGRLAEILQACTAHGFTVTDVRAEPEQAAETPDSTDEEERGDARYERDTQEAEPAAGAAVTMRLHGSHPPDTLLSGFAETDGVLSVNARTREEEVD